MQHAIEKLRHLQKNHFPLFAISISYIFVLLFGEFLHLILGTETLEYHKTSFYFLNSKNTINQIFAYNGNLVWFLLFCLVFYLHLHFETVNSKELLPTSADVPVGLHSRVCQYTQRANYYLFKQYFFKYCVKSASLFVIFFAIDTLFVLSGGSCDDGSGTTFSETCRSNKGKWEGGFDISGHFCFLITISLILWCELYKLHKRMESESFEVELNVVFTVMIGLIVGVIMVWFGLLWITAIYYHTFFEKVLGCMLGFVTPLLMYYTIPSNEFLNGLLYK
ncbi:hypothetical protein TPHA_0E01130 [Tetrapisispora phaffii CBS 4417]|uniref:Uncharacterized protein n=1 Tax=Tetrapisispora phaffii (strain ATCC 24235 / CBS 4417 / NBRC 1672 / NRRL Y-8282 / UCD 70-5) TaxID=1071381 RepID=G8BTH9_TETPH|nr:hypothetical protein TPHA_0E01130 [Tetrapisispora phaffii CBS 4417]CCE63207.1 hypothetical protein TPHA_0E01130 [Tetrapisispora phaffii CBS 4417]